MRTTAILFFLLACGDDRQPVEAPFITCPPGDVIQRDTGAWVGTATVLIAPPGTFPAELVGAPLDASLVGHSDDKLEVVRGGIREDGGLHAVIEAESTDIRGLPVRVSIGPIDYIVHAPVGPIEIRLESEPAFVESPDDQMHFAATLNEPVELGAFLNRTTDEMIELASDVVRIDERIEGHEGHKALVGVRTASGTVCIGTPCGCSEAVRAAGRCGLRVPIEPGEPDEPI